MFLKKLLAIASILFCGPIMATAHAQTPVAFIGGDTQYYWANSGIFGDSARFKFVNYGYKYFGSNGPCHEVDTALETLQQIIQSNQKPVVHLLLGADDADGASDSSSSALGLQTFETCFANLVTTAKKARLKVVIGTNPFAQISDISAYNSFLFAYGAANSIPVIDYQTLLNRSNDNLEGTLYEITPANGGINNSITNKGYAIMNALADEVLSEYIDGVTLKAGYLGVDTLEAAVNGMKQVPQTGVNTVYPGAQQHWQAWGHYSDGITRQIDNANVNGVYGTWTSSNPEVISIDLFGNAWALVPGTANVHFTTLNGQTINEWVMHVDPVPAP